jgi:hypothetical protein
MNHQHRTCRAISVNADDQINLPEGELSGGTMVAQLIDDSVALPEKKPAITSRKSRHSFARQPQTEMTVGLLGRKGQSKQSAPAHDLQTRTVLPATPRL